MRLFQPRRSAHRRTFRPELGALETRALLTRLGAVAPRTAGVVQIQNHHGQSTPAAGMPLTALAGHWQSRGWASAIGAQLLGLQDAEFQGPDPITIRDGVISGSSTFGDGRESSWSIRPLPGGQLELELDPDDSIDQGLPPILLPGRKVGLNAWSFEGPTPEGYPGANLPIRFSFTFVNRDTLRLTQSAQINGRWVMLVTRQSDRQSATPRSQGGDVAGLELSRLAGDWQGQFTYTKYAVTQLGRPNTGPVAMRNTLANGVLTLNETRPGTSIVSTYTIRRLSKYTFEEVSDIDNQFDGGQQPPPEPGRQVGVNSWTFQNPLPEEYPGPFQGYRRTYSLINRDRYTYTLWGLKDGQWNVLLTQSMERVPAPIVQG